MDWINWLNETETGIAIHLPISGYAFKIVALIGFILVASGWVYWVTSKARLKGIDKKNAPLYALALLLVMLGIPLFLMLMFGIYWVIFKILPEASQAVSGTENFDLRWYLLTLTALTASLGAVVALPFTILKTIYNRRQTNIAEQGHITDQINKAVENLGSTRDMVEGTEKKTVPNLEIRIGGLLALERISKQADTADDHIQVMEIISAYIRENARAQVAAEVTFDEDGKLEGGPRTLRDDLSMAFDIIDRRSQKHRNWERAGNYRLNFAYADFRGLELSDRRLEFADFRSANFRSANLVGTNFNRATLYWTCIENADLRLIEAKKSTLHGVTFGSADLSGADLNGATVTNVDFRETSMMSVRMRGSKFSLVKFKSGHTFNKVDLLGAAFRALGREDIGISSERLEWIYLEDPIRDPNSEKFFEQIFGSALSQTIASPDFHERWRAWQDEIGFDRETFELKPKP